MATFACPECGDTLNAKDLREGHCQCCGAPLPDEAAVQAPAMESAQRSENVAEIDSLPHHPDPSFSLESTGPEVKIPLKHHGETLAVLALLLPLLAQSLALAMQF